VFDVDVFDVDDAVDAPIKGAVRSKDATFDPKNSSPCDVMP
jgi:hypothetical protein